MPVNLASIKDLLVPGLRKVTGDYQDIPKIYDKVFEGGTSKMQVERVAAMQYLGLAALKTDGGATRFSSDEGELYAYNQKHIGVGIGYAITRNAIDDNLYKAQFKPSNLGLMKSVHQYKEIVGAAIFNSGTTFDANVGGDGKALFATDHPVANGGTIANKPTTEVDLNEASLLAAQAAIRGNFRDNAGLRMQARARKLMVPIALEPVAIRLTKTELRPGTSDNDVNAILATSGGIPGGYLVNDYLTSNFAWFLLSDQDGLSYLQRIPFETDMQVDFITDNLLVKAFERFSFSYYDFRAAYASFPTS